MEVFNESPFHTLTKSIMERALMLLGSESLSITQIAASLNYADVHQFSKAFKSFFGNNPTEMRARIQKRN